MELDERMLFILFLIGFAVFLLLFLWFVVYERSVKRLWMRFFRILIDADATVDPDAPIKPLAGEHLSDILQQKAQQVSFEQMLTQTKPPTVPIAQIPSDETGEFARDTSSNGWPRPLPEDIKDSSRPFLQVHLKTEHEELLEKPYEHELPPKEET